MLQFQDSSGNPITSLMPAATLPGIEIVEAAALSGAGTGRLSCDSDGIGWQAPGSTTPGTPITAVLDTDIEVADGANPDRWLRLRAWPAQMPAAAAADIVLGEILNNAVAGPNCSTADAAAGQSLTWSIALANTSATAAATAVSLSFAAGSLSAGLGFEFSLDGIAWQVTPLAVGTIASANSVTIHLRRSLPEGQPQAASLAVEIVAAWMESGQSHQVATRGLWRIFAPACYRIYATRGRPPVAGATPWQTSPSLPVTPDVALAPGLWYFSVSWFNGLFDSGFLSIGPRGESYLAIDVAGEGGPLAPPTAPSSAILAPFSSTSAHVIAAYSDDPSIRGTQWAVEYSLDGGAVQTAYQGIPEYGMTILDMLLSPLSGGQPVTARVAVRRNDGTDVSPVWTYSAWTAWQNLVMPMPLAAPWSIGESPQ